MAAYAEHPSAQPSHTVWMDEWSLYEPARDSKENEDMLLRTNLVVLISLALTSISSAGDATSFIEPPEWEIGTLHSTYQEWDVKTMIQNNPPDYGYLTNGPIAELPRLSALPTGFVSGTGNFYAFSSDYGFKADINNHGGSHGTTTYPAGDRTRVVVQISVSTNPDFDAGLKPDTLKIVDVNGALLTGGAPHDVIAVLELFRGDIPTPFGPTAVTELYFEYLLPAYTGDFTVTGQLYVHAGLLQTRVDTLIERPGDVNCDGVVNFADISPFIAALKTPADQWTLPCPHSRADVNGDGEANFADISAFIAAIKAGR